MWGVMMALSNAHSGCSAGSGSVVNTSSTTPPIRRSCRAAINAVSSTSAPRPMLKSHAVGFIAANARAPITPRVSSVSGSTATTKAGWAEARRAQRRPGRGKGEDALDPTDGATGGAAADHAHAEGVSAGRDRPADVTEPEDRHRLVGQPVRQDVLAPAALVLRAAV